MTMRLLLVVCYRMCCSCVTSRRNRIDRNGIQIRARGGQTMTYYEQFTLCKSHNVERNLLMEYTVRHLEAESKIGQQVSLRSSPGILLLMWLTRSAECSILWVLSRGGAVVSSLGS